MPTRKSLPYSGKDSTGSSVSSVTIDTAFDLAAGEFLVVGVVWEGVNSTCTVDDNGGVNSYSALTKGRDSTNEFSAQLFWCDSTTAKTGCLVTAHFSPATPYPKITVLRYNKYGTITLVAQGTPNISSGSSFTIPSATAGDLAVGLVKEFAGVTTSAPPKPYGVRLEDASMASHMYDYLRTQSGSVSGTGTFSASASYAAVSATFADSGSPPSTSSIPSWYSGSSVGTCVKVPGLSLYDSGLDDNNGSYFSTASVFSQYSGAIVSTKGMYAGTQQISGASLIVKGSGHVNGSNEVLGWGPIQSEYPGWYRLRSNTSPVVQSTTFDGSGNPVAVHTYNSIAYDGLSTNNRLVSVGGVARYSDAGDIGIPFTFNLDQSDPETNLPWTQKSATTGGWRWCAWDAANGTGWGMNGTANQIRKYVLSTDTETVYTSKASLTGSEWFTAFDSSRGIALIQVRGSGTFYLFDTTNPAANDYTTPSTSGTAPTAGSVTGTLYDPVDDYFVFYVGSNTLYYLKNVSGTWTWSNQTYGGDTADSPQTNGTYGRFGYVAQGYQRGYLLVNGYASNAYVFRPTSATIPDTTPDAFTFTDRVNVALSTVTASNAITVSGINAAAAISVSGGEYRINGGSWTSSSGTVSNGDSVEVRGTSSASLNTNTDVVLTIGGVSDTFTITTVGPSQRVSAGFGTGAYGAGAFGGIWIQGSSGSSYSGSVSESASAAGSQDASIGAAGAASESASAASTQSVTANYAASAAEAASAADAPSATSDIQVSANESASAADSPNGGLATPASATESASASETESATVGAAGDVTEAASAATVQDATAAIGANISEATSAADTPSASIAVTAVISESASAADACNASTSSNSYSDSVSEAASAAASQDATVTYAASVSEAASAADNTSTTLNAVAAVSEAAAAVDNPSATFVITAVAIEAASAQSFQSATGSGDPPPAAASSKGGMIANIGSLMRR